ncbi:DUF3953 domain-containing protein [Priestia flexa]|uniref:DUF3953 domain-containing protein n=2 Tax=Bacillaceae TaxID=186817 RepID=UPI00104C5357|nr:DUF3953 domain-containing protein [Bacillus sp. CBEL-1]
MLIRLQLILSVIALPLMVYSFITKDYTLQPYATLLFGLIMLIIGLVQFQNKSKGFGWLFLFISIYTLYRSVESFLLK